MLALCWYENGWSWRNQLTSLSNTILYPNVLRNLEKSGRTGSLDSNIRRLNRSAYQWLDSQQSVILGEQVLADQPEP